MNTRVTAAMGIAAAGALFTGVLAGCGTTDAERNEALARAEASARPAPEPTMTLQPCPGGEIMRLDPAGTTSIKPDCFDQAVAEAIAEFPEPLPAGTSWLLETTDFSDPEVRSKQGDISIADGVQDTTVAGYWLCAWMDSYLQALDSGDATGQEHSMEYLAKYTSLPAIQENMVNPEVFDASVIAPAQAGDPAQLREFFKGDCSSFLRSADSSR
ncbi:hypothetical protein NNX28_02155 [Arthrobacter sp. zg-Y859]|uniref:Lipoprotein n=1 Tax=Arthrobacter jinronghuae TaxID=2964609 RepID=A0ABT1NNW5_9MICC|nr:hypothetical protein [Arthrobacter jinronghuae]MCQ1948732.1 hypothetical protein [Arthrobacter jinronghuae]UWX78455.1 hypothetical protein N2K98_16110 [Arthrobacter jinronghuae]